MEVVRNVGQWVVAAKEAGVTDGYSEADWWVLQASFSTLTNVNFSDERIAEYVRQGIDILKDLQAKVAKAGGAPPKEDLGMQSLEGLSTV